MVGSRPFIVLLRLPATCWSILVAVSALTGCSESEEYPERPVTIVCPWAAGGGTDRVSRQIAVHLEQELGVPVSVINATGGKGVTGHHRGLRARPDGYTLTMATLELNMMHWSGLTDLTHLDCIPLMSVNEDYAALLVRDDAPWASLAELDAAIGAQPGTLQASGTASGGAWHLALAGWLLAAGHEAEDVIWVSSTGAGPSLQELLGGGLDMVCCSLPEASALLESGDVRALGVMSPERARGYEEVPTFREQGVDWTLGGWRGLAVPLGTPQPVVTRLTRALERIVTGRTSVTVRRSEGNRTVTIEQTFPDFMSAEGFDATWRGPAEFRQFLVDNDQKFGALLTSDAMKSVNRDPFPPLGFPGGLALLALGAALAIGWRGGWRQEPDLDPVTRSGARSFAVIVGFVVLYLLLAETLGFVLTVGLLLPGLLVWFGNSLRISLAVTLILVPATYQLFAHLLRVPLPRGWLGW